MPSHPPSTAPARITVVESEACHFCDDARRALKQLSESYRFTVETVEARNEAGRRLMQVHRASMSPLVLVDGRFFSHGRLPRRKLTKLLDQRQRTTQVQVG